MGLQRQTNNNSTSFRLVIGAILLFSVLGLLVLVLALGLYWTEGSLAQQPEPGAATPALSLQPASGPVNTPVRVYGQGWPPDSTVLIYLASASDNPLPGFAILNAPVDVEGRFIATFTLPAEPRWAETGVVRVVGRTQTGEATAQAFFRLIEGTVEPTATPPPTLAPTQTATTPSITPVPSPEPGQALATAATDLYVRRGPGTDYAILGMLQLGQSAAVTGLAPDRNWWQIRFPDPAGGLGWVSAQHVVVQHALNIPIVQPPPLPPTWVPTLTPIPTPIPFPTPLPQPPSLSGWRGEYFDNPRLSGPPVLVRRDASVQFGWGSEAPGFGVPADNFSVRWEQELYFSAGVYRFEVLVDDGARLWIDDRLVIDRWRTGPPETFSAEVTLSEGQHHFRVEYFEYVYDAQIHLSWERLGEANVPDRGDWRAEYFDNPRVEGVPVLVRNEDRIDHNWGDGSPAPAVPADNFSARWLRQVDLPQGEYVMRVTVDDGVRVWVDDVLAIDEWRDGEARTIEIEGALPAGRHWLKVEYYERGGQARIRVDWFRQGE